MKLFFLSIFSICSFADFLPKSFSVDVTQSYVSQLSGKTKISKAKIDYQYPGKLRYKNADLLFVTNSEKSWQFLPTSVPGEKNELIISSKNHVIGKLFDALKAGLKTNNLYKVDKRTDSHFILHFTEQGKETFRLKSVEFFAYSSSKKKSKSLKDVKRMGLEYIDGKKMNLEFSQFLHMKSFSNKHFVFKDKDPSKTKIIKQ